MFQLRPSGDVGARVSYCASYPDGFNSTWAVAWQSHNPELELLFVSTVVLAHATPCQVSGGVIYRASVIERVIIVFFVEFCLWLLLFRISVLFLLVDF